MKKYISFFRLSLYCLLLSVLAHAVYLIEWTQGRFMVGINDGLSQMLPFKKMLYEQYSSGEFFYSSLFGFGSGTYSELAYYFSTSIVFAGTVVILFGMESIGLISELDILFWANAAVFISIVRLTAVLMISYSVFRYFKFDPVAAFLGASIYGLSGLYFRHAVYWEFFADAYLWFPLLILGVEKIFREGRPAWFIAAVAITMFDNFYFAYVNLLLTAIYIGFRLFLPLVENEVSKKNALKSLLVGGILGAGISAVSFIPAVYGYFNNHRPLYEIEIPWFFAIDNILYTSSFIVLPAIFVLLVFAFPLYKDARFRFFTLLVLVGIALHYSPKAASMFNGFSAPQYRWEYFISFMAGGSAAAGFSRLHLLTVRHLVTAGVLGLTAYTLFAVVDVNIDVPIGLFLTIIAIAFVAFLAFTRAIGRGSVKGQAAVFGFIAIGGLASAYQYVVLLGDQNLDARFPLFLAVIGSALFTFMLITRAAANHRTKFQAAAFVMIALVFFVNGFQYVVLVLSGDTRNVSEELITGPEYDDPEIRTLLDAIQNEETDSFYRIEWMEGERNNTNIVQDFHSVSAYSSILNKELLYFYLYDLQVDMERESLSRYATLGKRTNLHSLLVADYTILLHGDENVPADFIEFASSEHYTVYQNTHRLPFLRSAEVAYSEEDLAGESVLSREHAMLSGVILEDLSTGEPLPDAPREMEFEIQGEAASYDGGVLTIEGETGGIDLLLDEQVEADSDLYVSFHLVNRAPDAWFPLTVNSYRTTRKSNASVYKVYADDLTIRIPADETVSIRMPQGQYELTGLMVSEEPYDVLRQEEANKNTQYDVDWQGSRILAQYNNMQGENFLVMPVPFEIGWSAKVNGESVEVLKANYAFIALPAVEGLNEIELTYRPPFFIPSLVLSTLSLLVAILFRRKI
ncbi:MAG TPA: YfhO family protein [Planococcus sp. (in: firmicutes)]|nr:YfhO family protein [Planococcus sp. (in: firmicutes)]